MLGQYITRNLKNIFDMPIYFEDYYNYKMKNSNNNWNAFILIMLITSCFIFIYFKLKGEIS